jgi:hypothetical protein
MRPLVRGRVSRVSIGRRNIQSATRKDEVKIGTFADGQDAWFLLGSPVLAVLSMKGVFSRSKFCVLAQHSTLAGKSGSAVSASADLLSRDLCPSHAYAQSSSRATRRRGKAKELHLLPRERLGCVAVPMRTFPGRRQSPRVKHFRLSEPTLTNFGRVSKMY